MSLPRISPRLLLLSGLFIAGIGSTAAGQPDRDTLHLTLSDCIRIGIERGPAAEMARASFSNKEHLYHAFFAGYLPQLSLSGNAPQYIRSINSIVQPDGSSLFQEQRLATSSLTMSLLQQIPYTGTEIRVYSQLNRLDNLGGGTRAYQTTPLSFWLHQPLFSINTFQWNSEQQDLTYRQARRSYVEAMEDASIDVVNKFFGFYLASMNVSNAQLNLAINDTLYQISKGRFNVGKIAENDLLQSELAFLNARTEYDNAKVDNDRAAQDLKFSLGIQPATTVVVHPDDVAPPVPVDSAKALSYARRYRSEVVGFESQKLAAERSVRQAQSDNLPSLSIDANVGLNQKADQLPVAYRNLLDQQQLSLQLSMPLFGWGTGSQTIEAARAEESRVETSVLSQQFSLDQEVIYQVQRFNLLQRQVGLAAKADTVAQRRFDVARERFVIGKISIPDLFLAQSEKDNAYRNRIQTLWNYWQTYYRLRRLTLYDFTARLPLVGRDE